MSQMLRYSRIPEFIKKVICKMKVKHLTTFKDNAKLKLDINSTKFSEDLAGLLRHDFLYDLLKLTYTNIYLDSKDLFQFFDTLDIKNVTKIPELLEQGLPAHHMDASQRNATFIEPAWHHVADDIGLPLPARHKRRTIVVHIPDMDYSIGFLAGVTAVPEEALDDPDVPEEARELYKDKELIQQMRDLYLNPIFTHVFCFMVDSNDTPMYTVFPLHPEGLEKHINSKLTNNRLLRIFLNLIFYINSFPDAFRAGLPKKALYDKTITTCGRNYLLNAVPAVAESQKFLEEHTTAKTHIRKGHFRVLKNERYVNKRWETIYVKHSIVNRKDKKEVTCPIPSETE